MDNWIAEVGYICDTYYDTTEFEGTALYLKE